MESTMLIYNLCLFTFCQSVRCHSTVLLMFCMYYVGQIGS
uniref:Uncharacterized protein n=1 Tax=Anguilla anguilla TaxID=7936 RepID=A0A0E9VEC0_ANGAN